MVLNDDQQANLFNLLARPVERVTNAVTNNTANQSSNINLSINVGSGGNYDMDAAKYTVDQLVPVLGDALLQAKEDGRLRNYENAR